MTLGPGVSIGSPVPRSAGAPAQAQNLGNPGPVFRPQRLNAGRVSGLLILALLAVALGFVSVASLSAGEIAHGLVILVLTAVFALVVARALANTPNFSKAQAAKAVCLFERGMVLVDRDGPKALFAWDSMSALQNITRHYVNGVHTNTSYVYTLVQPDGSTVKIDNFYANISQLGQLIQERVTNAQAPLALAAISAGQVVPFGDMMLNAGGVGAKGGSVPWSHIQEVKIVQGMVHIKVAGQRRPLSRTPVRQIPNFFVFLTLAEHLRRTAR